MSACEIAYRLPLPGWPRAILETDHVYSRGRLVLDGHDIVEAVSREHLLTGAQAVLPTTGEVVMLKLEMDGSIPSPRVVVGDRPAVREDELKPRPSRSAWRHALLALAASAAGFIASYLYLGRAESSESVHAFEMATHMAGWHLLLTLSLFPASLWGRRAGIHAVQATSALFFCIHAGIALANALSTEAVEPGSFWIGTWNAVSGLFFLAAVFYGNVAYRDMDPARALLEDAAAARRG